MRVVRTAVSLNLPVSNDPEPPGLPWDKLLMGPKRRMQRLARLRLSAFGRAGAASAYGLQTVTWHMEHGGLPPAHQLAALEGWAARLVDRRQGPEDKGARLVGVPTPLLTGSPAAGGFGLLPLQQHVRAREAVWAVQLALHAVAAPSQPTHPWVTVVAECMRMQHPAFRPWAVLNARDDGAWVGGARLPAEITRLVGALAHLPRVRDVGEGELQPGPWCAAIPLWGNPALPNAAPADSDAGAPRGLELMHAPLPGCPHLRTVGDLVRALDAPQPPPARGAARQRANEAWMVTYVFGQEGPATDQRPWGLRARGEVLIRLNTLARDIHPTWLAAARAALAEGGPLPSQIEAMGVIIPRLGWRLPGSGHAIPLRRLTVRVATQLQMGAVQERRASLATAYVQEAWGGTLGEGALQEQVTAFVRGQRRRWSQVRWEAEYKEPLWRLALDGIGLRGSTHLRHLSTEQCACGGYGGAAGQSCSPRVHHFWECPVAVAVRRQAEGHLSTELGRHHMWLGVPPLGCQEAPWDVVSMAMLWAAEHARQGLRAAAKGGGPGVQGRAGGPQGSARVRRGLQAAAGGSQAQAAATATPLQEACLRAAALFWSALRSFAALGMPKRGWQDVGTSHPILWVSGGQVHCAGPLPLGGGQEEDAGDAPGEAPGGTGMDRRDDAARG